MEVVFSVTVSVISVADRDGNNGGCGGVVFVIVVMIVLFFRLGFLFCFVLSLINLLLGLSYLALLFYALIYVIYDTFTFYHTAYHLFLNVFFYIV